VIRRVALLLAVLAMPACKSGPLGPYLSPRVTGQVVAAGSGEALSDVKITRGKPDPQSPAGSAKGGEVLMRKIPVRTDANGGFNLASERVLSVFRGSGWSQVHLTFEHAGYECLRTNYSTLAATNSPGGELTLDVGTVRLQPGPPGSP